MPKSLTFLPGPTFARGIDSLRRNAILQRLDRAAIWFTSTETVFDCRDTNDNKYLELALAARARAIITGDKDLLVLNPWRDIHILSPSSFLNAAN